MKYCVTSVTDAGQHQDLKGHSESVHPYCQSVIKIMAVIAKNPQYQFCHDIDIRQIQVEAGMLFQIFSQCSPEQATRINSREGEPKKTLSPNVIFVS